MDLRKSCHACRTASLCDLLVSRPNHDYSIATARLLPPPGHFEPNCSPHTPTTSFRARPLVSHLHRVHWSLSARHPPPPCLFERNRSFPASIASNRARTFTSHLRRVYPSAITHLSPRPSQFECEREHQRSFATPIYLSIPSVASQTLAYILNTVGPYTVV